MTDINSVKDFKLIFLLQLSQMFNEIEKEKRERSLTTDTVKGLVQMLNGRVDLCQSLLTNSNDFVMVGNFSTDPLEKELGKLRQGSEGTYLMYAQQVVERLKIKKYDT